MKVNLIKKMSKKTFKCKDGKERHGTCYFIESENGKHILIAPVNKDDYPLLDLLADYVKTNQPKGN